METLPTKEFYKTIDKKSFAEFKDRGSKFLAFAFPIESVDDFKKQLQILKKEHPKSVHQCFAYRLGTDGNNFRSSDDGEPSGSAGKPILGQIDSKEVTNVAIVVVRYWGGTLLGVPGLINAYKSAAAMALQVVPIVQKVIQATYCLHFDYTQMNNVMHIVKQHNCDVLKQQAQLFIDMEIGIPISKITEVLYHLNELQNIEVKKK